MLDISITGLTGKQFDVVKSIIKDNLTNSEYLILINKFEYERKPNNYIDVKASIESRKIKKYREI